MSGLDRYFSKTLSARLKFQKEMWPVSNVTGAMGDLSGSFSREVGVLVRCVWYVNQSLSNWESSFPQIISLIRASCYGSNRR